MPELQTRLKKLAQDGDPSRNFTVKMYPPPENKMFTSHRDYRYTLNGPPRQMNDALIRMVIKAIRELSKDHMLFAATRIWPHNLDETLPIWPGHAGGAVKLYAFTQSFEEFPMATEIRVARGTTTLTTDNVQIRKKWKGKGADREPWTELKRWLLELPIPAQITHGTDNRGIPRVILAQQLWWSKRGKSFRLMSLPIEIRLIIFQHALGENIYPRTYYDYITNQDMVCLGSSKHVVPNPIEEPNSAARSDAPNYAVLLLNKGLRDEALRAGYQDSRKHFTSHFHLQSVINASPTSPYKLLSRIHLHFNLSHYFEFFGINTQPVIQHSVSRSHGSILQGVPELRHLELFFPSPYGPDQNKTPWRHHSTWSQVYPCQKTAVDCILTFAFPYIKDIPHVHLIGCIKSCTKFKWYYILNKEYEQRKEDYRTHGHNHEVEVAALLGKSLTQ